MAKKQQAAAAVPPARVEPEQTASTPTAMSIKMTVGFRDWLGRMADSERITSAQLIEKAVVEYAERRQFKEPAPRRTEGR